MFSIDSFLYKRKPWFTAHNQDPIQCPARHKRPTPTTKGAKIACCAGHIDVDCFAATESGGEMRHGLGRSYRRRQEEPSWRRQSAKQGTSPRQSSVADFLNSELTTMKTMQLIDKNTGEMRCKVCGAVHYAMIRPNSNGSYYRGAWQCHEHDCPSNQE